MQKSPYQYEAARKPSEDSVSVDAPANKKESFLSLSVHTFRHSLFIFDSI